MKGKQREKRRIFLFIFTIISVLLFFIPTGLNNDQINFGFKPKLGNIAPYMPTDPYPPDGAKNLKLPVTLNVNVSDPDADPMYVYFYNALDDSLIGIDTVPNGSTATCTWTGLQSDKTYRWYVISNDSEHETISPIWNFTTESSYSGGGGISTPINQKPIANIIGPNIVYVGEYINFSAQNSYDPDGYITGYRWDFNNDGLFDTNWMENTTATYTYFITGNYYVKLQVKDNDDATSTDYLIITIIQQEPEQKPPIARTNGPYDGVVYENITFSGVGSYDPDGTIINYTWNFGDGTQGYRVETIHSYKISGSYNITLNVTDNDNITSSSNTTIANILIDSYGDGWKAEEKKQLLLLLLLIIEAIIITIIIFLIIRKHYEINRLIKNKHYEISRLIKKLDKLKKKQQKIKKRANKLKSIGKINKKRAITYYHTKSKIHNKNTNKIK